MAYVAVKGGRAAIDASLDALKYRRLKNGISLDTDAVAGGMRSLIDQVMSEGSLYSIEIASLAIKQAEGSPEEAVFLVRAYRSTLPRKHYSTVCHPASLVVERRISACFKDIPGGQILGYSPDYAHRLLDFTLTSETADSIATWLHRYHESNQRLVESSETMVEIPKVVDYLRSEGLLPECPSNNIPPVDITKKSLEFPTVRSERLQILSRGQTGAVTAFGYAALRGYGALHPTVGELRVGLLPLSIADPFSLDATSPDNDYYIGEIRVTEVETLVPVSVPRGQGRHEIEFELGYGLCFGQNETKAIAMSLLDHCLETGNKRYPTHDEEFVLYHIDSVESTGFISHLKLPHYVTFQAKLDSVRKTRRGGVQ